MLFSSVPTCLRWAVVCLLALCPAAAVASPGEGAPAAPRPPAISCPYTPAPGEGFERRRLKGQLHCHYRNDANPKMWDWSPRMTEAIYREMGYDFVALTEHHYYPEPPAPILLDDAGFTLLEPSEEVTGRLFKHVLGLGVDRTVSGDSLQNMVTRVREAGGVAFLAHPFRWLIAFSATRRPIRDLEGLQGISIYTAPLLTSWEPLWDYLLRMGKQTQTPDGRSLLLPGFSEDDYTPPMLGSPAGATWIDLTVDCPRGAWSTDATREGNRCRSDLIKEALRTGQWWSYWVRASFSWGAEPYPRLSLAVTPETRTIEVTSDLPLREVQFIGARGPKATRLLKKVTGAGRASYTWSGKERYVRVFAKYRSARSGKFLCIAGNAIGFGWPPAHEDAAGTAALPAEGVQE